MIHDLGKEQEAFETVVASRVQSEVLIEERDSLMSTGRRLSRSEPILKSGDLILLGAQGSGWLPEGCLHI